MNTGDTTEMCSHLRHQLMDSDEKSLGKVAWDVEKWLGKVALCEEKRLGKMAQCKEKSFEKEDLLFAN